MNRKAFLTLIGSGPASVAVAFCLGACAKNLSSGTTAPTNVDFTLDLNESGNTPLLSTGGFVYRNGVIVARTISGTYIAVQQVCTHENVTMVYQGTSRRFYCDGHGATFSETGVVTGGPAPQALQTYVTSLTGNSLRVHS
jgi:cytochrome b6-f complex iron-sulfur subunit